MKCLVVFGTRPEAIKMAVLVERLRAGPDFECEVCCTAQHREMLDQVLEIFGIDPDYDLDLMQADQSLAGLTARVLAAMEGVLDDCRPDAVFVQGDTTTTMAAALSAFYRRIPVHHVEAGLRTRNRYSPFPEEINRQITSRLASVHYAPTALARDNLLGEGVEPGSIVVTGNTVIDALLEVVRRIEGSERLSGRLRAGIRERGFPISERRYLLVTGHRRENFGEGLRRVCQALARIASEHPDIDIVYPVHLNPNVLDPVKAQLSETANIHLIPPLDYLSFVYLMMHSHAIITDSGGIQEEAPSLGKPVLVTRDTTERPEGIEAGSVVLTGADAESIAKAASRLLSDERYHRRLAEARNPFGDGDAAVRIEAFLAGQAAGAA